MSAFNVSGVALEYDALKSLGKNSTTDTHHPTLSYVLGVSVAQMVFVVFWMISIALVMTAAWKNRKPMFLIPWLGMTAIGVVGMIALIILSITECLYLDIIQYVVSIGNRLSLRNFYAFEINKWPNFVLQLLRFVA